jgi:hypothetical protein
MSSQSVIEQPIKARGDLTLIITHVATGRQRRISTRNLITYDGLTAILHLLAQDGTTPSDYQITELVPGTNGTPPTRGDLGAYSPVPGAAITLLPGSRVVVPATGELIITATLPQVSPANGFVLTEAALMLANGKAFARQVHPAWQKQVAFTLTYEWRIALTV